MGDRAYILLDILDNKARQALTVLRRSTGVVIADVVEGPPDICILMEAPNREQLAKLTVQALASVENITENVRLLPIKDRPNRATKSKLFSRSRPYGKTRSSKTLSQSNQVNPIP